MYTGVVMRGLQTLRLHACVLSICRLIFVTYNVSNTGLATVVVVIQMFALFFPWHLYFPARHTRAVSSALRSEQAVVTGVYPFVEL